MRKLLYLLLVWILSGFVNSLPDWECFFFSTPYQCIVLPIIGQRVQESMRRADPGGVLMCTLQLNPRRRRRYSVRAPNSLWHIDGNHKLIRYRKTLTISSIYFTVDFTTVRHLLPSLVYIQISNKSPSTILINLPVSLEARLGFINGGMDQII